MSKMCRKNCVDDTMKSKIGAYICVRYDDMSELRDKPKLIIEQVDYYSVTTRWSAIVAYRPASCCRLMQLITSIL